MTDELKQRAIESLEWLVTDAKYRADIFNVFGLSDTEMAGNYSPDLQKAIELLEELKNE